MTSRAGLYRTLLSAWVALVCLGADLPVVAQTDGGGDGDRWSRVREMLRAQEWPEAIALCRKWAADEPENGEAWFNLGHALHGAGELEEAIAIHTKAATFPGVKATALYNLACAYALTSRRDEALTALEAAKKAGYRDVQGARSDADLASIRDDVRFPFAFVHKYHEMPISDRTALHYAVVLPKGYEPGNTYPVLIAMPPGGQTEDAVDTAMFLFWGRQAAERGWVVASPVVPPGSWNSRSGTGIAARFLDAVAARFHAEGGKFHLAGCSNGGRSAFRFAIDAPERFHSLSVIPGQPYGQAEFDRLDRLAGVRVNLFVGEEDETWVRGGKRVKRRLDELGIDCSLVILPGEGHVMQSLTEDGFMDRMEHIRRKSSIGTAGDS